MKHKVVINSCYGGYRLSEEAIQWLKNKYGDGVMDDILERHDPRLVDCVETLGKKANGEFSRLAVVEIDSNQYRIDEYDGRESIETPDSIAWIVIEEDN